MTEGEFAYVVGVYAQVKEANPSLTENLGWLPLTAAVVNMVFMTLGTYPAMHILSAEIFPTEIR